MDLWSDGGGGGGYLSSSITANVSSWLPANLSDRQRIPRSGRGGSWGSVSECYWVHPQEGQGENQAVNTGNLLGLPFLNASSLKRAACHRGV